MFDRKKLYKFSIVFFVLLFGYIFYYLFVNPTILLNSTKFKDGQSEFEFISFTNAPITLSLGLCSVDVGAPLRLTGLEGWSSKRVNPAGVSIDDVVAKLNGSELWFSFKKRLINQNYVQRNKHGLFCGRARVGLFIARYGLNKISIKLNTNELDISEPYIIILSRSSM